MQHTSRPIWEKQTCEPFEVIAKQNQTRPFVFNFPHSGRMYPDEFISSSRLDDRSIRASEDFYVDHLFAGINDVGVPMLRANFPRAWLDVNREPYELDPKMFKEKLPSYANINSIRVAGGLGTIPKVVAENCNIYKSRLSVKEALGRIDQIYHPYHETLRKLIAKTHSKFGYSVLVDCHSMPSNVSSGTGVKRPDFIVGDRYGSSANKDLSQIAMLSLTNMGYNVARNKPYAGGFITEHYGRPHKNLHAIQIEINRGLYIDEATLQPKDSFGELAQNLTLFCEEFMYFVEREFIQL